MALVCFNNAAISLMSVLIKEIGNDDVIVYLTFAFLSKARGYPSLQIIIHYRVSLIQKDRAAFSAWKSNAGSFHFVGLPPKSQVLELDSCIGLRYHAVLFRTLLFNTQWNNESKRPGLLKSSLVNLICVWILSNKFELYLQRIGVCQDSLRIHLHLLQKQTKLVHFALETKKCEPYSY